MGTFQYTAKTLTGELVTGVMQADNEVAVVRTLDERRLFTVHVAAKATSRRARGTRVRLRDLATLYGQLADLQRSGVPLLRSLETLVRAASNPRVARLVGGVQALVADGKTLAEAMGAYSEVFGPLHTAMIRAGERGGFLEEVLTNLSGYLDRVDDLRSKVRGAMIYPAVLTFGGMLALVAVLVGLVPQFQPIFANMPLPAPTKLLFAVSTLMVKDWPVLLGLIILGAIAGAAALRSPAGRRLWDRWQLKIPAAGKLIRVVCITRFCRILGTMLANGVPILQALAISKDAVGSAVMAEKIALAAENVKAGQKLAAPLGEGRMFPVEIVEMIAVAEESNQLEKVLVQIADNIERRTNRQVDAAVRLVEPVILVMLAAVIGFVALGLLYPIFTMARTLR